MATFKFQSYRKVNELFFVTVLCTFPTEQFELECAVGTPATRAAAIQTIKAAIVAEKARRLLEANGTTVLNTFVPGEQQTIPD